MTRDAAPIIHSGQVEAVWAGVRRTVSVASCSCGWKGPDREAVEWANGDLLNHYVAVTTPPKKAQP